MINITKYNLHGCEERHSYSGMEMDKNNKGFSDCAYFKQEEHKS